MDKFITYNRLQGSVKTLDDAIGKIPIKYSNDGSEFRLYFDEESYIRLYHEQDCCESVYLEDICGDMDDIIGSQLFVAEEVSVSSNEKPINEWDDSFTWTYYRFATNKGDVTLRWYGTSNGYYSESVSIDFVVNGETRDNY